MKLQIFLFLFFVNTVLIFGQGVKSSTEIDSVLTHRYHEKFEVLLYVDAQKSVAYIDSLSLLIKKRSYPKANYYYHLDLGAFNFVKHHLQVSQTHYQKAYQVAKDAHWNMEAVSAKIWLANLDYFNDELSLAESKYREVLSESISIGFVHGIANAYYGLADLQSNKNQALQYLIKVDSVYQSHQTISPILANTYEIIGRIYLETFKKDELAKEYFLKALEVSKQTNYRSGIDYVMNELIRMDFNDNDYENLNSYLNGLLDHNIQQKDTIAMARNLVQIGKLELNTDKLNLAESHLLSALDYFKTLNNTDSRDNAILLLSRLQLKKNNPTKAQHYLDSVPKFEISMRNSEFVEEFYAVQIKIHELNKDYQAAFHKQQELDNLKSVFNDQRNDEAFLTMERQFQTKKKVQAIALLTSQNELTKQQKSNQRNFLLSIILVTALAALSFYALYRNRQKVNRKLEELNVFKSKFYANISHEFRTPLTLLIGPIEKQLDDPDIIPQRRSELNLMARNTHHLLNLVNQLLDLSKLESGQLKLHVSENNLQELLSALVAAFEYQASQKHIDFKVNINTTEHAWFDIDLLEKVVINLLSNAFKYSAQHADVIFSANISEERLIISIENEGHPLTTFQIEHLFDRFYQADDSAEGVGIGLSYVKDLVTLSHGTISVEQLTDTKLAFTVDLPISKEQFTSDEIKTNSKENHITNRRESNVEILLNMEPANNDDLPIILIIDDNHDIRIFLQTSFKDDYQIIEASNGNEGYDKALEFVPDLIISDVMMPVMNGYELTSKLKQDLRTCHIPIILLTAKAEESDEFTGLNTGADDYVVKPFKLKLLQTRVKNLLANRAKIRQRYSQELILKPQDIVITNLDELFFDKLKIVLDEKLTESSFSVEDFSKAVGMSRMQLHRKLKALTGLSATEFIRNQRLKLATTLIGQSDINISEIGYMVGFNDHSYFAKCFKKAYGCTPSEYDSSKL